jgi:glycopeptide antibiotics resistance protein
MHAPNRKPAALGYALLAYMTLVVAAITLMPFEFKIPARIQISLHGSISDALANVVLFIPIGFLFQLARRRSGWPSLLQALGFGVLVSAAVEACQLFLPGRVSSLIDVGTNGLGAVLGAAAAAYQRASVRQEEGPLVFAFEMPLMNVVYLLIPLLWLGGLSMGGELDRLGLTTVLGLFGGSVIASVCVHRTGLGRRQGGPMPPSTRQDGL